MGARDGGEWSGMSGHSSGPESGKESEVKNEWVHDWEGGAWDAFYGVEVTGVYGETRRCGKNI